MRALVVALGVLACALAVPAAASAEEFTVDSTADAADSTPGVGCLVPAEECTLRAAIETANASEGEFDVIGFDETVFDGQLAGTIDLGASLPAIVDPVSVNGRSCVTAAGVGGPCVGLDGPGAGPALVVDETEEVEIWGLAVTGTQSGIDFDSSPHFRVQASWFGVDLGGSPGGNATGIAVGPGSNRGLVGGEGPERGNVVANSSGDGLDIHGASNVRVLGNYFGVEKDGSSPGVNGKDIEVTADGEFAASGTAIGTNVGPAATTPECDGGCNLISAAASNGIDLEGDGGSESPAVTTTILGNYIGLDATGAVSIPNAVSGVHVGSAAQTVVGGRKAGEANRINGGDAGVQAGPEAPDLVVRGNLIGVDAAGTGSLAPPGEGVSVDSGELASAAVEAVILDNEIEMEGGVAISQRGFGATISGNRIFGAKTGIRTSGFDEEHGNLIAGNSIEGLEANGILVENSLNEIQGNEVFGAAGAGILIQGSAPFEVTENLVGGDAAAEENAIVGSGGAAIEISNVEESENEVARNRGTANGGLFLDLVAAFPLTEPKGPNEGIKPPAISTATQSSASGAGAEAGARVRVFRKQSAAAGEIQSFLGETTAGASGGWKVVYGGAIPAGTVVAATQTSEAGGTSELASATTPGEAGGSGGGEASAGGGGGPGGGVAGAASGSADAVSPQTRIVRAPKKESRNGVVRFEFESDEAGSTFQCKLDGTPFRSCGSPKKYRGLRPGQHLFKVRAVDPAGNVDSSPAKRKFTVGQ